MCRGRAKDAPPAFPAILSAASGGYEGMRRTRISVAAVGELVGKKVEMRKGNRTLALSKLNADGSRTSAKLILPMPPRGKPFGKLTVLVGGDSITTVNLPNADQQRATALMDAKLNLHPYVFSGTKRYSSIRDEVRVWKRGFRGQLMETCCALHNFRLNFRPWHYEAAISQSG